MATFFIDTRTEAFAAEGDSRRKSHALDFDTFASNTTLSGRGPDERRRKHAAGDTLPWLPARNGDDDLSWL